MGALHLGELTGWPFPDPPKSGSRNPPDPGVPAERDSAP